MTSYSLNDGPPAQVLPVIGSAPGRARDQLMLQFSPDADGRTYISRQYVAYPFHVCRALYNDSAFPDLTTLTIQSCSGGLYEEDRLDITVEAKPRAAAHVTTQASTVVHSMPTGMATQCARIRAEAQSYLEYLPDPQILFPQSRLRSTVQIGISAGAIVLVSDSLMMHDPTGAGRAFTSYMSEIQIEDDSGRRLAIDRMTCDGATYRSRYPGVMGAFGAQGTIIAASIGALPNTFIADLSQLIQNRENSAIGVSQLPKSSGILVRILASDGATLRREMRNAWSAFRFLLKGSRPSH